MGVYLYIPTALFRQLGVYTIKRGCGSCPRSAQTRQNSILRVGSMLRNHAEPVNQLRWVVGHVFWPNSTEEPPVHPQYPGACVRCPGGYDISPTSLKRSIFFNPPRLPVTFTSLYNEFVLLCPKASIPPFVRVGSHPLHVHAVAYQPEQTHGTTSNSHVETTPSTDSHGATSKHSVSS